MTLHSNIFETGRPLAPGQFATPSRLTKLVQEASTARGFWWMTGIEGTTIPHIEADEFEWIQHYRFWDQDLTMIRQELAANWIRLCFPWYKLNPAPGQYDWDWMDRVVERAAQLGFQIALDPIHFGTPLWLADGFGTPDFPQYAAQYFEQIARRYGANEQVAVFVPHNEPTISALFGGLLGEWPPYRRGQAAYNRLLGQIARSIVLSRQAVCANLADPVFLYIDALDQAATRQPDPSPALQQEVELINERRFLAYDLISGRVGPEHGLYDWLLATGLERETLEWLHSNGAELDLMGLDFYTYSEAWLSETADGRITQDRDSHGVPTVQLYEAGRNSVAVNVAAPRPLGLYGLVKAYYDRYQRPIVLTETDFLGTVAEREAWLGYSLDEVARLRAEGLPVLGYTWWGATDHLNWGQALKERNNIHPVGLWSLVPQPDGSLARVHTRLVDRFRSYVETATTSAGAVTKA